MRLVYPLTTNQFTCDYVSEIHVNVHFTILCPEIALKSTNYVTTSKNYLII